MAKPTTHVLVVTDKSGSMAFLAADVRGGFNTYVADLRKDKAKYRMSVTLFDTNYLPLCANAKLDDVPDLTQENYSPGGNTALLDAVGRTVTEFDRVKLAADDRVLLVIQTDGHENSSREWTWQQIRDLLDAREKTGQWAIVYLGQGADAWDQGGSFGASTQVIRNVHTNSGTRSAYSGLSVGTVSYSAGASAQSVGQTIAATPGVTAERPTGTTVQGQRPRRKTPAKKTTQ